MSVRFTGLAGSTIALVLALAGSAQAATVGTEYGCYTYQPGGHHNTFRVTGRDFTPVGSVALDVSGHSRGSAPTSDTGSFAKSIALPSVSRSRPEQAFRFGATDADSGDRATALFRVTLFDANITPPSGRPDRRVRIQLNGWGAGRTIWLHYVAPGSHRSVKNLRIARTAGTCGHATARLAHLYPFRASAGTWRLQFDAKAGYSSRSTPRISFTSTITRR